ncbi:MAG: DUF4468 domain-containing protein [Bacteroidaceae bacterium]|nr:DUF4468 domain-containing protein [Bacteroidaceae bacterium]
MKKVILFMLLLLPLTIMAQTDKNSPKYLRGAVPEENGVVVFNKTFSVAGQSKQQLYDNMLFYIKDNLVVKGIEDAWTRLIRDGKEDGVISARVEEWMVFSKKFLSLDQTRFRYQITAEINDKGVKMTISQISYLYGEEWNENKPTGEGGTIYRAEEWITDKVALNKQGTKVLSLSGKFRRKTIDRVEEIFENAMDMFEEKVKEQTATEKQTEKPKRQFVTE